MGRSDWTDRTRHLGSVRRSFSQKQRLQRVGFVGPAELHNTACPAFQEASRWPDLDRHAMLIGSLEALFRALLDDFVSGDVEFPILHDCLRD